MNDYKNRYAKIFRNRKDADNQKRQKIQFELSKVKESLKRIDMMESVLEIPVNLNSYTVADQKLLEKAMCGDTQAANLIAEKYLQIYSLSKNKAYHNYYLQWSAFSILFDK